MIASVIRTRNDMVMVFDEEGQEIPELQGPYAGVKAEIFERANGETSFKHWYGTSPSPAIVRAEEW